MIRFEDGMFSLLMEPPVTAEHAEILYRWTGEICLYRLHVHFERRGKKVVQ
jgi:hypothetical protein